jgi:hypothetical protein
MTPLPSMEASMRLRYSVAPSGRPLALPRPQSCQSYTLRSSVALRSDRFPGYPVASHHPAIPTLGESGERCGGRQSSPAWTSCDPYSTDGECPGQFTSAKPTPQFQQPQPAEDCGRQVDACAGDKNEMPTLRSSLPYESEVSGFQLGGRLDFRRTTSTPQQRRLRWPQEIAVTLTASYRDPFLAIQSQHCSSSAPQPLALHGSLRCTLKGNHCGPLLQPCSCLGDCDPRQSWSSRAHCGSHIHRPRSVGAMLGHLEGDCFRLRNGRSTGREDIAILSRPLRRLLLRRHGVQLTFGQIAILSPASKRVRHRGMHWVVRIRSPTSSMPR